MVVLTWSEAESYAVNLLQDLSNHEMLKQVQHDGSRLGKLINLPLTILT